MRKYLKEQRIKVGKIFYRVVNNRWVGKVARFSKVGNWLTNLVRRGVFEKVNFFLSSEYISVIYKNFSLRFEQLKVSINKAGYWFEYRRPKWYLFHKWSGWVKLPKIYERIRVWLFDKGIEYQIGYHEFIGKHITRRLVRKWLWNELRFYYFEYFVERLELVPTQLPDDDEIFAEEERYRQLFWVCLGVVMWIYWECLFAVRVLLLAIFLWPLGRLIDFIFHDIAHAFLENFWWKTLTKFAHILLIEWPVSYRKKSFNFFVFTVNTGKRMLSFFFIRRTIQACVCWIRKTYSALRYRLFFIRPMERIAKKMRFELFILDETQWKYARAQTSAFYLLFLPFIKYRVPVRQRLVIVVDRFLSRRYMLFPVVFIKFIVVCFLLFVLSWIISAQDLQYERIVSWYGWMIAAKKLGVYIGHNHTYMLIILILILFHVFLLFFVIPMVFTRVLVQMRRRRAFREDPVILGIWNRGVQLYLRVERFKEVLCDIIVLLVLISWYIGPFLILYLRHWVRVEHILPRMPTVYYFTYWYQFWQRGYDKYIHWFEPHLMDLRRLYVFVFRSYYIRFETAVVRVYTYLHDLIITTYEPIYELFMFYYKVCWVAHSTVYQWMEVKHPIELALSLFEYAPHWHHNLNITYFFGFLGSTSGLYFFHRFWLRTVWYGSTCLQLEAIRLSLKVCFFHLYGLFFILVAPVIYRYDPETVRLLVEHSIVSGWLVTG